MRTRTLWLAAGLSLSVSLSLSPPVLADTPIGPGVTGAGGTGANKSDDPRTGAGPGTEVRQADREGSASSTAKGGSSRGDANAGARTGTTGATGNTGGVGAGASGSVGSNVKGGTKQY